MLSKINENTAKDVKLGYSFYPYIRIYNIASDVKMITRQPSNRVNTKIY